MPNPLPTTTISKGRSKRLVEIRNKKMIIRYYYWREIQRRRTDDVFVILSRDEFFLEEITVRRIIRDQLNYYTKLKQEQPTEKRLQVLVNEFMESRFCQSVMF